MKTNLIPNVKVSRKEQNPTKKLYGGTNLQNRNHLRISGMPKGVSTILKAAFNTH